MCIGNRCKTRGHALFSKLGYPVIRMEAVITEISVRLTDNTHIFVYFRDAASGICDQFVYKPFIN